MRITKTGFRAHPIDRTAEFFDEPLADARLHGIAGENFYHSERNPPYWRRIDGSIPELFLRHGVIERLKRVNGRLAAAGLELFLFDAWRPKAVQAYFHDVWMPAELKARRPELTGEALIREVENYWAAPTANEAFPAPHATGAATDLTIRWIHGEQLWMGSLFDDVTKIAHRDYFERDLVMCFSDEEARANRRLLHWVMREEGFIGHPEEWWHFSYGDQLWAKLGGYEAAIYGLSSPV
ncbi:MAG TPA: M15 family metallopeptidase [Rhizomicrobium sp.]|nr:M15 family metallopeptidase [Rhizomicrobium sp.]